LRKNIPKTALNVVLFQARSGGAAVHPHPVLAGGGPGHEKLLQVQYDEYASINNLKNGRKKTSGIAKRCLGTTVRGLG
jgi:hypothetical protein